VSRIVKQKGLDYLLSVASQMKDVNFVIVGKGPEKKRLEKISTSNVSFLDYVSERELIDLYSRALIFCLPSMGEGFGFVIPEAMASGCAIVSTIPLGYKGFVVKPKNVEMLKKSIEYLIEHQDVTKKWGKENRKISEIYNWDEYINKLIKLYEELI